MTREEHERRLAAYVARTGHAVRLGPPKPARGKPATAAAARTPTARVVPLPCAHRGGRLPGEPCGSTLYSCRIRGSCSLYTPCVGAAAVCRTCPDRVPPPRP